MEFLDQLIEWSAPLGSPFLLLLVVFVTMPLMRSRAKPVQRAMVPAATVAGFLAVYHLCALQPRMDRWLAALNSPIVLVCLLVVLPAMHLPRRGAYRWFLVVPAALVLLLVLGIRQGLQTIPTDAESFPWLLVKPTWLIAGLTSLVVLVQPLLPMPLLRSTVRVLCLVVLVYGGFALRRDYADYQDMLARRTVARDVMNISETTPAMRYDNRLVHLPAAPCRFPEDGGYVQGCFLELAQRLLQVDARAALGGDADARGALEMSLAGMVVFVALSLVTARWWCGWLCPLSTMGEVANGIRKLCGLPAWRPSPGIKRAYLVSGLSLTGLTLLMARAIPHLDAQGKFAGCKLPIYPLCKICPNQQLCPVASGGINAYPPLPGTEWAFGFFRYGCLAVLGLFVVSFASARRLWCRFCPMGMISGLFNRGGLFRLRKDAGKCTACGVCTEVCPMDITVIRDEMQAEDVSCYHCVLCLRCVEKCPQDDCLRLEHGGHPVFASRFPWKHRDSTNPEEQDAG